MKIEEFTLERIQSEYENTVKYNLSDSGVHPMSIRDLLTESEIAELCELELGYGWTNGEVSLREAIAALYSGRSADEIIVTNGSAEANFLMVLALLDPGDEIVVFTPNYLQIWGWARAIGVSVKPVPHQEALDWSPDIEALRSAVGPNTRLITICHPNNPTGAILSEGQMREIVAIAEDAGAYLHADEVYKGAEIEGPECMSFLDLYEKAVVTSGMSKAMALPGLRIGWLAGPAQQIYSAWQRKDYTSITTSTISEYVAERALQPVLRQKILDRSKHILRENLDLLLAWVEKRPDTVSLIPPSAGGMAFVRYDATMNSTELAHQLRKDKDVFVLPGDVYGLDGYFRVGIGAPAATLESGLQRIGEYLESTEYTRYRDRRE